jgi:hypothetical protein
MKDYTSYTHQGWSQLPRLGPKLHRLGASSFSSEPAPYARSQLLRLGASSLGFCETSVKFQ